ncbi:MAG: HRDC domain-containing protein [Myxococcales bacterium]|nr:HRDC domain-containing protein [Myxococcales bacterium]
MFEDTPLVMVETPEALDELVERLRKVRVVAIDTESDSSHAYQEKVCLIQVSDLTTDYIVDPLAIGDISALGEILSDPAIVKVLHGADYDIVCLRRDYDFQIRGLFDTLLAAQLVGLERIGLADLVVRYFGIELDKAFQRHNWALRPLLAEHIEYARGDTHFLLALHEVLIRELRRVGKLRHQREECQVLERRRWQGRTNDPDAWRDARGAHDLDEDGLRVLRKLWRYRDEQARKMDRPVYKVIPDDVLMELADTRPETERELDGVINPKSAMRRRHGRRFLEMIAAGLADDTPLPAPKSKDKPRKQRPKTGLRTRLRGRTADRVLADLKLWRNEVIARNPRLNSFSVASNSQLKHIATYRPRTLDELGQVPDVRKWQVRDYGEELLERLDKLDP